MSIGATTAMSPTRRRCFRDSVQPVVDAGRAELIVADHRICDEITHDHDAGPQPRPS